MANKSELKLADGSRWDGDTVIDEYERKFRLDDGELAADDTFCAIPDVLAAIRAVDGDPEYLELKRLRAENEALRARYDESQRERDDLADQICSARRTLRRLAQSQRKGG